MPLEWSQPLALGTFYDTIMKPELEAHWATGEPSGHARDSDRPSTVLRCAACACTISATRRQCST